MTHSFLVESGHWNLNGYWLRPNLTPIPLQGEVQIVWKRDNWFKMTTDLTCDDETATKIVCQCRGNLNYEEKYYTYIGQHNLWGNIEGEGRLGVNSIVQHYWFMGTNIKQKGTDGFYRLDQNSYSLTSSVFNSHSLENAIEAVLKR
jgi:hypothetical protein